MQLLDDYRVGSFPQGLIAEEVGAMQAGIGVKLDAADVRNLCIQDA